MKNSLSDYLSQELEVFSNQSTTFDAGMHMFLEGTINFYDALDAHKNEKLTLAELKKSLGLANNLIEQGRKLVVDADPEISPALSLFINRYQIFAKTIIAHLNQEK